jgi:alpha-galactosidase
MRSKTRLSHLIAVSCAALFLSDVCHAQSAGDALKVTGQWTAPRIGAAATPPMGWNSWNAFHTEVDEEKVMGAAKALVDTGLAKLGYRYVNIDDGWWLRRRQSDQKVQIRTAIFPSADVGKGESSFKPYVDRLHAMGLKAGIYTDVGRNACSQAYDLHSKNLPEGTAEEREVGLYGHVDGDIRTYFKDWGFDYIKVDACGIADYAADRTHVKTEGYRPLPPIMVRGQPALADVPAVRNLYEEVGAALKKYNPDGDYVYSICNWGQADVRQWGQRVGNSWRTSDDIYARWSRMLHSFDSAATRAMYSHPGAWNDPDMLFIGTGDFDANHLTEARSHFTLWAMINAPLLIGYDLRNAPKPLIDILGNADLIAANQDPAGNQAVLAYRSDDVDILVKTLSNGRKAVVLFNRGMEPYDVTLTAAQLKYDGKAPVTLTDMWTHAAEAPFTGEKTFKLAPRESRAFYADGTRVLSGGTYLSEMTGSIHVATDGVPFPEADPEMHRPSAWGSTRGSGEWPGYPGWGGAQADASPYSTGLAIGRERFDTGIGILSNSRLEVRADRKARRFEAQVGVDNATRNRLGKVRFEVYGDGKLLSQSEWLGFGAPSQALSADATGVAIVELVVRQQDDNGPVAVTWGRAALLKTP